MKKREKLSFIRRYYPNAVSTIDSVNTLISFIEDDLDLEPQQVMLADSICCDDVNSIQYPARARELLGPFKMGGLDGFPFAGLTGLGACLSHVPDEGALFIYYGPHVGISQDGSFGEIHRYGMQKKSGCCGAAKKALKNLEEGKIKEGHITTIDYQQNTLEQILLRNKDRILAAGNRLKETTEVLYKAIDERMFELAYSEAQPLKCRYVILMGAILINSDPDIGSFTATRRFEFRDIMKNETTDMMQRFFADGV